MVSGDTLIGHDCLLQSIRIILSLCLPFDVTEFNPTRQRSTMSEGWRSRRGGRDEEVRWGHGGFLIVYRV